MKDLPDRSYGYGKTECENDHQEVKGARPVAVIDDVHEDESDYPKHQTQEDENKVPFHDLLQYDHEKQGDVHPDLERARERYLESKSDAQGQECKHEGKQVDKEDVPPVHPYLEHGGG